MRSCLICLAAAVWCTSGCMQMPNDPDAQVRRSCDRSSPSAAAVQQAPPAKPVSPEQVNPGNAHKKVQTLWEEMERASQD